MSPSPSASPTPSPPTSKADFIAQGNAICTTMNNQQKALPTATGNPAQEAALFDKSITITQSALNQLKALPQPPADAATLAGLYAQVSVLIPLAQQESADLKAGNTSAASAVDTQLSRKTDAVNAAYIAYGLTVCGSP